MMKRAELIGALYFCLHFNDNFDIMLFNVAIYFDLRKIYSCKEKAEKFLIYLVFCVIFADDRLHLGINAQINLAYSAFGSHYLCQKIMECKYTLHYGQKILCRISCR